VNGGDGGSDLSAELPLRMSCCHAERQKKGEPAERNAHVLHLT
jgi:hypothetical protein